VSQPSFDINDLLRTTVQMGGSDVHIKVGRPPLVRLDSELIPLDMPPLSPEQAQALSYAAIASEQQTRFEAERELDFSYILPDVARFRGSLYFQRGLIQSVFRALPLQARSTEELKLPPVCRYFAERPHGLVLVGGQAGSGRSTTLAALVDYINRHFLLHVVIVEALTEFVHRGQKALITQREVGRDAVSAQTALRGALRQDPDVLVAGELDTPETVSLALAAAEAGHLVFGTVSAPDAGQAVERLIDAQSPVLQTQARMQLSVSLVGVISQTLVPAKDGTGRVASFETLVGLPPVRALVREGKTSQIHALMQTGAKQGMITQDQSLANLVKRGVVTYDAAREHAHNLTEFHFLCTEGQSEGDAPPNGHYPAVTAPGKPSIRLNPAP
jgi:twitching motility protein PilT